MIAKPQAAGRGDYDAVMVIIVMGVSGSGKTAVGRALAERLGAAFIDADDHHSAANKAKNRRVEFYPAP